MAPTAAYVGAAKQPEILRRAGEGGGGATPSHCVCLLDEVTTLVCLPAPGPASLEDVAASLSS